MTEYTGLQQRVYSLSDVAFAAGGEATLYYVNNRPGLVAKIYKPERNTREREEKLKTMVKISPASANEIAWPTDILYDKNGVFSGFIMHLVKGRQKLREIYVFDNRTEKWSYYVRVALNIAIAVYNVHEINQVIGDLNPENILVDKRQGLVTLVDTDSFHISNHEKGITYRCTVGMPEMIAPELQGMRFANVAENKSFNEHTDNFSLAVLIFQVLMNGANPFACKVNHVSSKSASQFQPIDNIKNGICPYFKESGAIDGIDIPPYAPDIDAVPDYIRDLFKRAFVDGYTDHEARPSAREWHDALSRLVHDLKTCGKNPKHEYFSASPECPWCKVDKKMHAAKGKTSARTGSPKQQTFASVNQVVKKKPGLSRSGVIGLVVVLVSALILFGAIFGIGMLVNSATSSDTPSYPSYVLGIETNPAGATVAVDGVTMSQLTPVWLSFYDSKLHKITITKEGYKPITKTIALTSDTDISETLVPCEYGTLVINGEKGYSVYLDDVYLGKLTSYSQIFKNIEAGQHTLRISNGVTSTTSPITIKPNEQYSYSVGLAKE